MSASIPPALAPTLQALLQARYGPEQREECAGWRGLFEETVAEDGSTVLVATRDVDPCETVFLIDHLWCTTLVEARAQLQEHSVVRRNVQAVLGIDDESESEGDDDNDDDSDDDDTDDEEGAHASTAAQQPSPPGSGSSRNEDEAMRSRLLAFLGLEDAAAAALITDVDLDDIIAHPPPDLAFLSYLLRAVPRLFPNAEALSLRSLGIGEERAAEVKAMVAALPRLKALWLNGNDVARVLDADATLHARLEILNRRLTKSYSEWALRYLASSSPEEEEEEEEEEGPTKLDLAGRGLILLKPQAFAALPSLRSLALSRNAGLPLPVVDESDPSLLALLHALPRLTSLRLDAVSPDDETRLAQAFPHMRWINGRYITRVRPVGGGDSSCRLPTTVLLDDGDHPGDGRTRRRQEIVDKVLMRGWARLEPMRLAGPTPQHHAELHWCLLDLPGLALGHHEEGGGNVALLHMRDRGLGVTFTAAWPRVRIRAGERVTRDYLEGFSPAVRAAVGGVRLLECLFGPRLARRLLSLSSGGESGGGAAVGEVKQEEEAAAAATESGGGEAGTEPLFPIDAPSPPPARPLLVFTDMPVLRESLGLPAIFAFTDDAAGADIVWTAAASPAASPKQQQRQQQWRGTLPNLEVVDDKCGMARLLRHHGGPQPPRWLPQTFCLPEELPALLRHWCECDGDEKKEEEDERLWILKPPHLARGWDIAVASELPCVLRHLQASGRLSVSRYLPRPALWSDGHKYDLRFYTLLLSPTQVLIHDHFRVRRAAQPYSLQRAHRQELRRHLTNTTLGACTEDETEQEEEEEEGCPTETLHMDDFIAGFCIAHPGKPAWPQVRARIEGMLANCFARLAVAEGGLGARPDPYGRALLGVDVLLDGDTLEPYLLELNAAPNVIGIVRERPSFLDEVFSAAFVRGGGANCVAGRGGFRPLTQPPEAESRELV